MYPKKIIKYCLGALVISFLFIAIAYCNTVERNINHANEITEIQYLSKHLEETKTPNNRSILEDNLKKLNDGMEPGKDGSTNKKIAYDTEPIALNNETDRTQITNFKNGDTLGTNRLLIRGVSSKNTKIKSYAYDKKDEEILLCDTVSDISGKFICTSYKPLKSGVYSIKACSLDGDNTIKDQSEKIQIIIDISLEVPPPSIEALGDIPVSLPIDNNLSISDQRPFIHGNSMFNNEVVAIFKSLITTTSLITDSPEGDFKIQAPEELEYGDHEVIVYSITPDGLRSNDIVIPFEVKPVQTKAYSINYFYLVLVISLLSFFITGLKLKLSLKKKTIHLLIIISIHLLIFVSYKLYNTNQFFADSFENKKSEENNVTITYSSGVKILEPTFYDNDTKSRLTNIYESLVTYDENLNIKPELALSWGQIDKNKYEFSLRPNVYFHNGDLFTADDVISSFERAISYRYSEVKPLLSNIKNIQKLNENKIIIETKIDDPLILDKLTSLYIVPKKIIETVPNKEISLNPIGTGPYKFREWVRNEYLELVANKDYYKPYKKYDKITIQVIPNRYARMLSLRDNQTDILIDVPPSFIDQAKLKFGYDIKRVPSLESIFILFNFNNPYFKDKDIRESFKLGLDKSNILKLGGDYTIPLNQFVSSGVFGYNPQIPEPEYDIEKSRDIIKSYKDRLKNTDFYLALTEDNEKLGKMIQSEYKKIGINIKMLVLDQEEFLQNLAKGEADLYLTGWKFNNGDIDSLYQYIVHSKVSSGVVGKYNGINYYNKTVDELIEKSAEAMNQSKRLQILQDIMQIITEEDVIGIPLIETEKIYAIHNKINFIPRIDGLIKINEN